MRTNKKLGIESLERRELFVAAPLGEAAIFTDGFESGDTSAVVDEPNDRALLAFNHEDGVIVLHMVANTQSTYFWKRGSGKEMNLDCFEVLAMRVEERIGDVEGDGIERGIIGGAGAGGEYIHHLSWTQVSG